ncbi:MAG: hypothetical protein PHE43_02180 [Candidatus Nanoarchaeia archaeon]|nr:hypothetical protein [Candidatus Nanoarchaeia archaeon]
MYEMSLEDVINEIKSPLSDDPGEIEHINQTYRRVNALLKRARTTRLKNKHYHTKKD